MADPTTVVIIGAGAAGLFCAYQLEQLAGERISIHIVEADSRYGGRINTARFGSIAVDTGASFIHGIECNPMFDLATIELELCEKRYVGGQRKHVLKHERGTQLSHAEARSIGRYKNAFTRYVDDRRAEFVSTSDAQCEAESVLRPHDCSVKALLDEFLCKCPPPWATGEHEPETQRAMKNYFAFQLWVDEEYEGADFDKLSACEYDDGRGYDGGNFMLEGGYASLVEAIRGKLKHTALHLNKHVERVERVIAAGGSRRGEGGEEAAREHTERFVIHCAGGARFEGDHCVCTVSVGVLQARSIAFSPPLPPRKTEAIDALRMGLMNKVVLYYKTPWWSSGITRLTFVAERVGLYPWTDVYSGRKGEGAALLCWTACAFAEEQEAESDEATLELVYSVLREGLNRQHIPPPDEYVITRWRANPLTRGSWTYIPVGTNEQRAVAALKEPVRSDLSCAVLYFAGEACSRDLLGEVNGAYLSAVEVAQDIASRLE
eukprot:TRINITY_DN853_c0_g1_i1.p1 TRINITY_DN853_c0_g1~~TRINITY_DN853_c0_g1_i1.p1  ORF type:complete len:491 (+),score=90.58 TRINITY_DN853_c0_g1_i1:35-1507(+)